MECKSCGNSIADCSDPERVWYPYRRVCYATMERESSQALYADLHDKAQFHNGAFTEWSSKRSRKFPVRFDEGVQIGVAAENLTPWDEFTTKADASPLPPSDAPAGTEIPDGASGD